MNTNVRLDPNEYPTHTPQLRALLESLNETRAKLNKLARVDALLAFKSPEYKASKAAYRAYWDAVDADRANVKAQLMFTLGMGGLA